MAIFHSYVKLPEGTEDHSQTGLSTPLLGTCRRTEDVLRCWKDETAELVERCEVRRWESGMQMYAVHSKA